MFWGISPYSANTYLRGQTAFLNAMSFPYGFALNIQGDTYYGSFDPASNTPREALEKQKMLQSHLAYMPYIDVGPQAGINNIDYSKIDLAANKDLIQIKFASLNANLNQLISGIDSALASGDLTDNQKAELENKKAEAEDMLKRLEDFAKKSPNMDVAEALPAIEAMQGEYYDLRDAVEELMNKIQSGQDVPPTLTPEEIADEYENNTKPVIEDLLNNPDVSEEDKKAIQEKQKELEKAMEEKKSQEELNRINDELWDLIDEVDGKLNNLKLDDIKDKLENETKPAIEEILNNPEVSDEDKKALQDKLDELEKAIKENKPEEEVNRINNELNDLMDGINEKLDEGIVPNKVDENLTTDQIKDKLKNEIKPIISDLEDSEYLDDEDKQALKDKQTELKEAIKNGASEEEIKQLYKELNDLINEARFKVAVGKLDEDPHLSDADKAELQEKLEELEEAIANGASEEDLQKIYDDLNDMISEANDDIDTAKAKENKAETEAKEKLAEEYKKIKEEYENSKIAEGNELYGYLSPTDKKQLDNWFKAYDKAIKENKSAAVISNIVDNIKDIVKNLEEKAQETFREASDIAEKIYVASRRNNGAFFKTYSKKERTIVDNVYKINKDNIVAVLRTWTAGPYWQTNDSGEKDISLLETIYSEFHWYEWNNNTRRDLTEHLLTTIEEYAKENDLEMEAAPIILTIRGQIENKDIENASKSFRRLLQQVLGIPQHKGYSGRW